MTILTARMDRPRLFDPCHSTWMLVDAQSPFVTMEIASPWSRRGRDAILQIDPLSSFFAEPVRQMSNLFLLLYGF